MLNLVCVFNELEKNHSTFYYLPFYNIIYSLKMLLKSEIIKILFHFFFIKKQKYRRFL